MIYIVYTTQTTKKQYKFDLNFGWMDFESQIRRSSIGRDTIGYDRDPVPLDKFINAGLDIKFEGESSFEKALIKILPYNKPIRKIASVYRYLDRLDGNIRKVVETKLLGEEYKDIYELYDDIREICKKSAKSMVSLYTPMSGIYRSSSYCLDREPVSEKLLYENIEQIEASIQNDYGLAVIHCRAGNHNIVATEFHADLVKTSLFIRLDVYLNTTFTKQEFEQFREEYFNHISFDGVEVPLPGYYKKVSIEAYKPVFTTEEMNKIYFNN